MRRLLLLSVLLLILAACGAPQEATPTVGGPTAPPVAPTTVAPAATPSPISPYPGPDTTVSPGGYPSPHAVSPTAAPTPAVEARLYFVSDRGGQVDLWRGDSGGGDWERLTDDPAEERWPAFAPDGTWLAYIAVEGHATALRLLNLASEEAVVVDDPASAGTLERVAWLDEETLLLAVESPSRQILFFRVETTGESQRLIVENLPVEAAITGWSAAVGGIVVEVQVDGESSALHGAQIVEGETLVLGERLVDGFSPRLSPDGRYLAYRYPPFDDDPAGHILDLITMDRWSYNGIDPLRRWDHGLVWGPEGRRFAFVRSSWAWTGEDGRPFYVGGAFEPQAIGGDEGLYLAEETGATRRQLTEVGYDTDPAWSPDGLWLAFVSNRDDFEQSAIWLLDIETGAVWPFGGDEGDAWSPCWRP